MPTPVQGFEHLYEVDELGNVYSLGKHYKNKGYRILKPGVCGSNGSRYHKVVLREMDRVEQWSVHRLVAKHFIPNPNNLPEVNHKDENSLNNNKENLEWCTASYNKSYSTSYLTKWLSPEGIETEVFNLSQFCREQGLQQGNMTKVLAGTRSHHRGWKLISFSSDHRCHGS